MSLKSEIEGHGWLGQVIIIGIIFLAIYFVIHSLINGIGNLFSGNSSGCSWWQELIGDTNACAQGGGTATSTASNESCGNFLQCDWDWLTTPSMWF